MEPNRPDWKSAVDDLSGWKLALLLTSILVFGLALRLPGLAHMPPGLFFDETAIGVNARLIAHSGVDQYGERFPLFFRALDDYKEPLYLYSTALVLKLTELSAEAVRLPAVIWGILGLFVAFLLGREVHRSNEAGLWTALLLCVTPWHLQFSRIAWQAITLTVVFPLAVLFMLRFFRRNPSKPGALGRLRDAALAGVFTASTLYSYTTARLLAPASCAVFVAIALWRRSSRGVFAFLGCFSIAALPFAVFASRMHPYMNLRYGTLKIPYSEMPLAYLSYFTPSFLFFRGDPNLHHSTGAGVFPWYFAVLLVFGVSTALLSRSVPQRAMLAVLLFIPVLGSLTGEYPHATRTIVWMPFVQVISAGALIRFLASLKPRECIPARLALLALILVQLGLYEKHLYTEYPAASRDAWSTGYLPAMEAAAGARQNREPVHFFERTYVDWMYVTRTPADEILKHRAELVRYPDRYDPFDSMGKYDFLGAKLEKLELLDHPLPSGSGLWLVPLKRLPAAGVAVVFQNEYYAVFRVI